MFNHHWQISQLHYSIKVQQVVTKEVDQLKDLQLQIRK